MGLLVSFFIRGELTTDSNNGSGIIYFSDILYQPAGPRVNYWITLSNKEICRFLIIHQITVAQIIVLTLSSSVLDWFIYFTNLRGFHVEPRRKKHLVIPIENVLAWGFNVALECLYHAGNITEAMHAVPFDTYL